MGMSGSPVPRHLPVVGLTCAVSNFSNSRRLAMTTSSPLDHLLDLLPWIRHPQHQLRLDATWQLALTLLPLPLTLFLIECHLVRRSGTRRLRFFIALFLVPSFLIFAFAINWAPGHAPLSIVTSTSIQFSSQFGTRLTLGPEQTAMSGIFLAVRSAEFGLLSRPLRRLHEPATPASRPQPSLAVAYDQLVDAIDLSMNLRGIGFEFGQGTGLKLPPDTRSMRPKSLWLRQTVFYHLIPNYLVFDILNNYLLRYPAVHAIQQRSRQLTLDQLDVWDTLVIKALSPILVTATLSFVYTCCSLFAVVVLGSAPERWPPMFGNPWLSTSLHSFWALRWHQVRRALPRHRASFPDGLAIDSSPHLLN